MNDVRRWCKKKSNTILQFIIFFFLLCCLGLHEAGMLFLNTYNISNFFNMIVTKRRTVVYFMFRSFTGNKWNCGMNLEWVTRLNGTSNVRDFQNVTCFGSPYNGKPVLAIAAYLKVSTDTILHCPTDYITLDCSRLQ